MYELAYPTQPTRWRITPATAYGHVLHLCNHVFSAAAHRTQLGIFEGIVIFERDESRSVVAVSQDLLQLSQRGRIRLFRLGEKTRYELDCPTQTASTSTGWGG